MSIFEAPAADSVDELAQHLASRVAGRIATPADDDWDAVRAAWNLSVDQQPAMVALPENATDVAAVLDFARGAGLHVAPQGTGHNASPLGDLAATILLRTDRMREVTVDPIAQSVRVGAGVSWSEVTDALAPHGLVGRAGSSGSVGVAGFTLGGGYSWLARRHGLAANSVTAVELVTGDGVFHRVDALTEPELFWAVRGGGANVGIVCSLEFAVLPVVQVYGGALLFPIERAAEVLASYEEWTRELDESATTCVRLLRLPPTARAAGRAARQIVRRYRRGHRGGSRSVGAGRCGGAAARAAARPRPGDGHLRRHAGRRPRPDPHGPARPHPGPRRRDDSGGPARRRHRGAPGARAAPGSTPRFWRWTCATSVARPAGRIPPAAR